MNVSINHSNFIWKTPKSQNTVCLDPSVWDGQTCTRCYVLRITQQPDYDKVVRKVADAC